MLSADRLAPMAPGLTRLRRDPGISTTRVYNVTLAHRNESSERLTELATRAVRLERRRQLTLEAAERLVQGGRPPGERASRLHARLVRSARRARIDFHRTIDDLVYAGGFDLAMSVLVERRSPARDERRRAD